MRKLFCFLSIGLLIITQALSQVKIGDNPQNIDASSVLELESSSRVLVVTRIANNQMNTITPLRGALVYNTDEQCVFYYNGTQWVNLCEEENTTNVSFELVNEELVLTDSDGNSVSVPLEGVGEQSFTADAIVNFRETIIITQTGNTFNFEVGEITGENIADSTIQGVDFAPESITQDKIAPSSIGTSELQDNAVTDDDIDFFSADAVTLTDFTNDAGFITAAQLISPDANNAITDSNGAFYNDTQLLADIANNDQRITNHLGVDNDFSDQNERLTNAELQGDELVLTESGFETRVNLAALNNTGSDNQNLSLNGNRIEIDNGSGVDLTPILEADNIAVNPAGNIGSNDVQTALEELQTDIDNLNAGGGNTDEQTLATDGSPGNISISNGGAAITLNVNDADFDPNNEIQNADEVDIDPITGIIGDNVQLALEELQTDVDNLVSGGGADGVVSTVGFDGTNLNFTGANGGFNGNVDISSLAGGGADGFISNVGLTGNELVFTGNVGGFTGNVDLTPILGGGADGNDFISAGVLNVENLELTGTGGAGTTIDLSAFALDTDIFSLPDDTGATNGDVLITDGLGNYSWAAITGGGVDTNNFITGGTLNVESLELTGTGGAGATVDLSPFALETEVATAIAASEALDLDIDPNNEIQNITSTDGSVALIQTGNNFDLSVTGASDDQNIDGSILTGEILTIGIEGGTNQDVSLADFALETEVATAIAASEALDLDIDPNNEIQNITSTDGSVALIQTGNNFDLSVAGASDDQNIDGSILTGEILTIGIEGGTNQDVSLADFALETEVATAIAASEALDLDIDPNNEIQNITSTDGSVALIQTGNNFDLSVAGASDDQNIDGSILTGEILTIGIEGGTNQDVSLADFALETEVATAIAASEALDLDIDPNNEIQNITSTDGSVALIQTGNNFDLSVAGASDDQNIDGSILTGEILTIGIEGGTNQDVSLADFALETEVATAIAASEALDLDIDPINEIELPIGGTNGQILATDGSGTYSWVDDQTSPVSGTTGSVFFANTDGTATENNANLFWDNTNNRLGIGLNNPDRTLEVDGETKSTSFSSAEGTAGQPAYSFHTGTDTDTGMYRPAADEIGFSVGATEALRIEEDSGNTNVIVNQSLELDGTLTDINGLNGTAGQILSSTGTSVNWIDAPTAGAAVTGTTIDGDGTVGNPLELADDAVTTDKILDDAVTAAKIDDNAVTSLAIFNGTIRNEDINGGANIDGSKINPNFGGQALTSGAITANGNLLVNGTISNAGGQLHPDYVFQKYFQDFSNLNENYEFMPLKEIEAFIKKNHHLPGIKSAKQVKLEGSWNLSQSNLQNLEKIEELFLHTIEQEKKIDQLKSKNEQLSKELNSLKADIALIKNMLSKQKNDK